MIKIGQYYRHKKDRDIIQITDIVKDSLGEPEFYYQVIEDPNNVWRGYKLPKSESDFFDTEDLEHIPGYRTALWNLLNVPDGTAHKELTLCILLISAVLTALLRSIGG